VHVAERHGERVGGVMRCRHGVEPEQQLDHLLHLGLLGAAVADDGAFHLGRRVLDHRHPGLHRRQHRHAAGVTQFEGAADVGGVEQAFDGHDRRPALMQLCGQGVVDSGQPGREVGAAGGGNRPAGHETMAPTVGLDAPVAGALGAGVDAEDPHASEASISFSSMSKFDHTFCTSSWSSTASISRSICAASLPSSLM
jgi:hypothetical protein